MGFLQKCKTRLAGGFRGDQEDGFQISMISSVRLGAPPSMTSSRTNTVSPTVASPRARIKPPPGSTTKAWTTQDGRTRNDARIDKKYLHKLLRNRIYLGESSHKGTWYPGAHPAIIDHGLWGKVHELLAKDGHARSVETKIRSRTDALLRGLLYAPTGERMYPTYSRKNGRKYRYYVSKSEVRYGAGGKTYERIPADEVEAAAVAQIKSVRASPEAITAVCQFIQRNGAQITEDVAVMAMHRLGDMWERLYPAERHRIVNLMVERVDLVPGGLKVNWRELGWKALIGEFAPDSIGAKLVEVEAQ